VSQASAAQPAALGDGTTESKYVAVGPCRLVDTRLKGGRIGIGKTRAYKVRGTGTAFANQGGKANGCGIPAAASSIQATITAVAATGSGYLKAYTGSAVPQATFLNFTKLFNISNGGAVAVCAAACASDVRISVYGHSTNVVVDVQGYYIKPMFAYVRYAGGLLPGRSSRVVGASYDSATGIYRVQFDRDITHCVFGTTNVSPGVILFDNPDGATAVFRFQTTGGMIADGDFLVTATC